MTEGGFRKAAFSLTGRFFRSCCADWNWECYLGELGNIAESRVIPLLAGGTYTGLFWLPIPAENVVKAQIRAAETS
ncbi:hypothetical protein [Paenibacillus contaminans]|uniref:Uncharacterized protein n=1 Tax=Paenibacillus contaminans TaxID=450362 RepID=A0A329MT24_9BACL|nr:hypothetical protein [Paenibacillus contaminans]RAV22448.1 hypothetical protein DQG23_05780 [Paenibacillus contaminans]